MLLLLYPSEEKIPGVGGRTQLATLGGFFVDGVGAATLREVLPPFIPHTI